MCKTVFSKLHIFSFTLSFLTNLAHSVWPAQPVRILERCLGRLEFERAATAARDAEGSEADERAAAQQIDWHSFVVAKTIDFDEGTRARSENAVTPIAAPPSKHFKHQSFSPLTKQ